MRTNIHEIVGGERLSTRAIGDPVTNTDLYDTYLHIPGAKGAIHRLVKAKWHNGLSEDLGVRADKILMLQDSDVWTQLFGFACVVLKKDRHGSYSVQAWNPKTNGTGFAFTEFDGMGDPVEIEVSWNASSNPASQGTPVPVQRARPEASEYEGFYPFRTREGLPGARGVSKLLSLVDVLRIQHEVFCEYLKYAKIQGLAHKVLRVKGLNDTKYQKIIGRFRETRKEDLVIIDTEDEFLYASPQQNAYDPLGMLDFADRFITRDTALDKFMLTGDPGGHLQSSEKATAGWFADVKQEQDYTLPQYLDVFNAFGATDNVRFNDPTETTIQTQMAGIRLFREALEGLVEPQSIVDAINEYLGLVDDKRLKLMVQKPEKFQEPFDKDESDDEDDSE